MPQYFSHRIVVRQDLEGRQIANTIAHISAYVGNSLADHFATGELFTTNDAVNYPRNSQCSIIIKRAHSSEQLHTFLQNARKQHTPSRVYTRDDRPLR